MAGDWIKFERATANKPEVVEAAELLGISRREAVGLFVDYFLWLDENFDESRNGLVTHVSRKGMETSLHFPGFAAILERIGWATFDDEAWTLTVINAERHNGKSAKSRASNNRRQSRFRNANSNVGALPEKRREEISTNVDIAQPQKRLQEPTPEHRDLALKLGVSCQTEFLKYRDWLSTNGRIHKDERAGFRNWLRRAAELSPHPVASGMQASHLPAKLPPFVPHTEMPKDAAAALAAFVAKHKVG